jgi:signal transduction histidine kinase
MVSEKHTRGDKPDANQSSGEHSPEILEALPGGADAQVRTPSFIDRLDEADRQALTSRAHGERYPAGTVICHEGDPGDAIYVIEAGQVAVLKETSDGRFTMLANRGIGEILGEMSLVGQQLRSASLVAVEETQVLRIAAPDFVDLMSRHPGISWAVLNALNDRLQAADLARTTIVQEEQDLARRLQRLTTETERQSELARVRQETIELIVHDLHTPVAVLEGCLQMLRTQLPDEVLRTTDHVLALAERSSGRLLNLLDKLLAAARQEDAGLSLVRQPLDLDRLLHNAIDSVQAIAEQAGISLRPYLPPDLTRPLGDAAQLERVLVNLLDNAISYTPAGGHIRVAAAERATEVEVSVTDTGPGVPTRYRQQIFERFARVPGMEGRRRGFGLGLYFCRQAVQSHGGRIWVEPGPDGLGSRFAFTLPLGDRAGATPQPANGADGG